MPRIPDINDNELWIAETTLQERYGEKKDIQTVDTEVRVNSSDRELTECPALYWEDDDLTQCVISVLQTQADHDHKLKDSTKA